MITYGSSIKGRRDNNQDSFLILEPNKQTAFLAVADGIGGSVGGELASKLVIETAKKIIIEKFNTSTETRNLKDTLNQIYNESHKAIKCKINEEPNLLGMGTTLSCVLIHNNKYVWGNIGDSRIYHFADGEFHQITKDHSFIEKLALFEEEKSTNGILENYGHIVTRSLSREKDEPDIFPTQASYERLNEGDGILICSDGLLTSTKDYQNVIFNKYLRQSKSLSEFINQLISYAYEEGSEDNITCVSLWKDWNNL